MRIRSIVTTMVLGTVAAMAGTVVAGQTRSTGARKGTAGRGRGQRSANPNKAKLRTPAALTEKAPDTYKAKFDTSKGAFVVEVHRDWAPNGADRFYNLVKNGFYDDVAVLPRARRTSWRSSASTAIPPVSRVAEPRTSGRSGEAKQQARLHHLRDRRPRTRARRRCSSTSRTTRGSTRRASRRSARCRRAWTSSTSCTADTARARRSGAEARSRDDSQTRRKRVT